MGTLMLLRHGETTFNAAQVFTGLLDAPLAPSGEAQVAVAASLVAGAGLVPDVLWQSTMVRAHRTTELFLAGLGAEVEVRSTWQLVERAYGCLTGVGKHEARERHGEEAFFTWRRTMHGRPPAASEEQVASWVDPAPVADRGPLPVGAGESLADVVARVEPWWAQDLAPALSAGRTVFLVAHGNTLRALASLVAGMTDEQVERLNIPAGHPLVATWAGGRLGAAQYLDPDEAHVAAALVAAEGGT